MPNLQVQVLDKLQPATRPPRWVWHEAGLVVSPLLAELSW
jgi:hypothetical protein